MSKQAREMRQQLRAVAKENFAEFFASEASIEVEKKLAESMSESLRLIQEELGRSIGQISLNIAKKLIDQEITLQAWEDVMIEKLSLTKSDLTTAVILRKEELIKQRQDKIAEEQKAIASAE